MNESDVNALVERPAPREGGARRAVRPLLSEGARLHPPAARAAVRRGHGGGSVPAGRPRIPAQTGSFAAWLYRIAANVAVDHRRAQAAHSETPLTATAANRPAANDPAHEVGRALDLRHAIGQLTDEQRDW